MPIRESGNWLLTSGWLLKRDDYNTGLTVNTKSEQVCHMTTTGIQSYLRFHMRVLAVLKGSEKLEFCILIHDTEST